MENRRPAELELSQRVIGAAIEVHRELGPGLLESAYRSCMAQELLEMGLGVEVEVPVALQYRGRKIEAGYRLDLLVEGELVVELKAVRALEPLHVAQVLTYLRLSGRRVGLLINFNVTLLREGVKRLVVEPRAKRE